LSLFGSCISLVNIFCAKDLLAQTATSYRINVRYVRNSALLAYTCVVFASSACGYLYSGFFYDASNKKEFFFVLLVFMLVLSVAYLAIEGYRGLGYPCRRKASQDAHSSLKFVDGADDTPKNKSLIEGPSVELQKEQYINCNIFYGKFFTGDAFSTSTPFVIY
jgi:hypothetical protein